MTSVELVAAIGGGPTITAAGVGVWKLARMWIEARAARDKREDKREDTREHRLHDCEEARRVAEVAKVIAEASRDECRQEREEMRGHIGTLQDHVTRQVDVIAEQARAIADIRRKQREASADITGRIETAAQRISESHRELPAVHSDPIEPEQIVTRRFPPPPRKPREKP